MTDNATPSAAEIADIERVLRECEWYEDSTSTNAITLLSPIIKSLLAAVEAQAARIGALEAENARLRALARDLCRQLDDEGCMPENCKEFEPVHVYDVPDDRPSEGE